METQKLSSVYLIAVLFIMSPLLTGFVGANLNYADCMKNPFASACRGISAKRSQLPAIPALQVGDGRGETSMPNTHYHGASNAPDNKQMPPIVELLVAHRWLLSECAALRLPSMVDMFQVNPSLLQQPSSGIDRNSNQGAAFQ